jgi:hypothetical protein
MKNRVISNERTQSVGYMTWSKYLIILSFSSRILCMKITSNFFLSSQQILCSWFSFSFYHEMRAKIHKLLVVFHLWTLWTVILCCVACATTVRYGRFFEIGEVQISIRIKRLSNRVVLCCATNNRNSNSIGHVYNNLIWNCHNFYR